MEMQGEERIAARRDIVWAALNDPEHSEAMYSRLSVAGAEIADRTLRQRQDQDRPGFGILLRRRGAVEHQRA